MLRRLFPARRLVTRVLLSLLPLAILLPHVFGCVQLGFLQRFESYLYDVRVRAMLPNVPDPRIVIVDIDELSLTTEGEWPWPRDRFANLLNALFDRYGVRVVGFDVFFADPQQSAALQVVDELRRDLPQETDGKLTRLRRQFETDRVFGESLIARDVVLGYVFKQALQAGDHVEKGLLPPAPRLQPPPGARLLRPKGFVANLPGLQANAAAGGFFDTPLVDDDGLVRRMPLLQYYNGRVYESLALAVTRLSLGSPPLSLGVEDGRGALQEVRFGTRVVPVDAVSAVLLPFRGPVGSFPYVSATRVLRDTAAPDVLKGAIVLVGTSAPGLLDLRATPVGKEYIGVEAHANVISGLLDGSIRYVPTTAPRIEAALLLALALLATLLLSRSPLVVALTVVGALAALAGSNVFAWQHLGIVLPLASCFAYLLVATLLHLSYGYFFEARRKQRLGRLFGQYVPPEVVQELEASETEISLAGENRVMSVLFSDVRGFTTISEGLDPRALAQFMNEFLTPMTAVIQGHRGTIDKYMGDAVMAFWGAPLADDEHATHAVQAALDMVDCLDEVNTNCKARGWPEIHIGVGVSSGPMNVGNMGSRFRMAYTVLGDTVNLGSRMEGLTKEYGVSVIVSAATTLAAPGFAYRELDLVRVKGKLEPIAIYEPLGPLASLSPELLARRDAFVAVLRAYRARDFATAQRLLAPLRAANDDRLFALYEGRIQAYLSSPPHADWDVVYTFTTK
ncbi:MAG: adenylate/guanylate cyclase domain-containing protein [Pseudomonadota bacterium]